jgi:hypothetical protein
MMLPTATDLGPFLPWVDAGGFSDNIGTALGFFSLGLIGALVTIYLFLGEWLPSMGGKAQYETLLLEIDELTDRRDVLMSLREDFTEGGDELSAERREEAKHLSEELQGEAEAKTKRAETLHRRILAQGFLLYALLGGAFAVLFAETLMQALLVGFGWTAVADRFGLKREESEKAPRRDQEIRKLEKAAEEGEDAKRALEAIKQALRPKPTSKTESKPADHQEGQSESRAEKGKAPKSKRVGSKGERSRGR